MKKHSRCIVLLLPLALSMFLMESYFSPKNSFANERTSTEDSCWQRGKVRAKVIPSKDKAHPMSDFAFHPHGNFIIFANLSREISRTNPHTKLTVNSILETLNIIDQENSEPSHWPKIKLKLRDNPWLKDKTKNNIARVVFSPNANFLATGSTGGNLRLWDWKKEKIIGESTGHINITSIAFSPDSKMLASGSRDTVNSIRLWDTSRGRLDALRLISSRQVINRVAFSPDGKVLATVGNRYIEFWDPKIGESLVRFGNRDEEVYAMTFSPNGQYLAVAGQDGSIELWSTNDRTIHRTLTGRVERINSIAFSPDGKKLISGGTYGSAKLWNLETGKEIRDFKDDPKIDPDKSDSSVKEQITSVSFHPTGKSFAVLSADQGLLIFSTNCSGD